MLEPQFSPDGEAIVYSVSTVNQTADLSQSDLWRVRFDGSDRVRLTDTPEKSEWRPQWSPDGKQFAFLSDRGDEDAKTQVWIMPAAGGQARKLTDFPGGAEDFVWSPDSSRLAVIAVDPELPPGAAKPKNPLADRHRTLPVQGRRIGLPGQPSQASVSVRHRERKGRAAHARAARRAAARLVAGRSPDRLCHQARRRPGSPSQLRYLPDRAEGGREGAATDDLSRLRPRSVLGNASVLESRQPAHRLPAERRRQVDLLRAVAAGGGRRRQRQGLDSGADRSQLLQAALGARRQEHLCADRKEHGHASVAHRPGQRPGAGCQQGRSLRLRPGRFGQRPRRRARRHRPPAVRSVRGGIRRPAPA